MKRSLTRLDVTCLGVNAIIGSGIFALPDDLYRGMGDLSPLAFVLCALGLAPVALCFAEASSRTDKTGGAYVYARDAFGKNAGFLVGWMCFSNSLFSFAAVAAIAAAYVSRLVPSLAHPAALRGLAAALILGFAALNYFGVKLGARAADLFTFGKVLALVVLVAAMVPSMRFSRLDATLPAGFMGVREAVFAALFAAQGFEVAPVPAEETVQSRRNVPIAILVALGLSSALYVIVQTVVVCAHEGLGAPSDTPLADAALAVAPALGMWVIIGGIISTLGFVSGNALGTPRFAYAFAQDGYVPRSLAMIHPRFATPHRSIVAVCVVAVLMSLALDYRALFGMSNVTVAVQYLATCAAVLVLRKRANLPEERPGFRIRGGALIPFLGIGTSLWIFTAATTQELTWSAGALVAGVVLAILTRRSLS